jgi:hypothetical protein
MPTKIDRADFAGWENCWRIANGEIELIVTADVGPRVIYFAFAGGPNLLKNFEDQMGRSGEDSWMIRGGSRIWIAPEDRKASYAPDNAPVEIEVRNDELIATAPVEESVRVQKQMVIRVPGKGSAVEIRHRVQNAGLMPTEFAVWVLTVMAPGGTAVTGFPPRASHPEDLAPSNPLVMWAFTDLSDPRMAVPQEIPDPAPGAANGCSAETRSLQPGHLGRLLFERRPVHKAVRRRSCPPLPGFRLFVRDLYQRGDARTRNAGAVAPGGAR